MQQECLSAWQTERLAKSKITWLNFHSTPRSPKRIQPPLDDPKDGWNDKADVETSWCSTIVAAAAAKNCTAGITIGTAGSGTACHGLRRLGCGKQRKKWLKMVIVVFVGNGSRSSSGSGSDSNNNNNKKKNNNNNGSSLRRYHDYCYHVRFWAKLCIYLKDGVGCVPCMFHFNWRSHIIRIINHPSLLSDPNSLSIASSMDPSDSFPSPCFAWPLADIRRQAGIGKVPRCGPKREAQILSFSAMWISEITKVPKPRGHGPFCITCSYSGPYYMILDHITCT